MEHGEEYGWEIAGYKATLRLVVLLVVAPLLALILILCRGILPPVFGFGSCSVAVDFRYLIQFLVGVCIAPFVLIPFFLAWMPWPFLSRVAVFIPAMLLATATGVIALFIGTFGIPIRQLLWDSELLGIAAIFGAFTCGGISAFPLGLRAWKGWQLTNNSEEKQISKKQQAIGWIALGSVVGILLGGGSLLSFLLPGEFFSALKTFGPLWVIPAMVIGFLAAAPMILMLRDNTRKAARIVLVTHAAVFLVLPFLCFWLIDYTTIFGASFVGSGQYFIGAIGLSLTLAASIFALRARGYRMRKMPFEKQINQPVKRVVVDPFSD